MALSEDGRDTLARALTTAYPAVGDRLRLLSAAGLGHVQASGDSTTAWRGAVDEAIAADLLDRLLTEAGRDDAWLAGLAADVAAGRPPGSGFRRKLGAALGAVSVVLLLGIGGLTWIGVSDGEQDFAQPGPAVVSPVVVPEPVSSPVAAAVPEPVAVPVAASEPVAASAPVAVSEPVAASAPVPVPTGAADAECGAPDGNGRIGWVYVGERAPKVDGDRLTLPTAGNVRVDYPNETNRWNARAKARCWLPKGTRVRLAGDVAAIPPHDFWAPIGAIER